jgi:hypothetical protein
MIAATYGVSGMLLAVAARDYEAARAWPAPEATPKPLFLLCTCSVSVKIS